MNSKLAGTTMGTNYIERVLAPKTSGLVSTFRTDSARLQENEDEQSILFPEPPLLQKSFYSL